MILGYVVALVHNLTVTRIAITQNRFDFFVVSLSFIGFVFDLGSITSLRLLRLLRVVRLLHKFPALRTVTTALLLACNNVG